MKFTSALWVRLRLKKLRATPVFELACAWRPATQRSAKSPLRDYVSHPIPSHSRQPRRHLTRLATTAIRANGSPAKSCLQVKPPSRLSNRVWRAANDSESLVKDACL